MKEVMSRIEKAQEMFRERILHMQQNGGLTRDRYIRFLSMQYHLTKGVQRHFYMVASNSCMAKKKELRNWLVHFAQEEEFHFDVARLDLKALGAEPVEMPLDTKLWWLYYNSIVEDFPFIRLGGTCILENVSTAADGILQSMMENAGFLNQKSIRFVTIHRHGPNLDHGNQVLKMLEGAKLSSSEYADLIHGTEVTTTFYLRAVHWVTTGEPLR
jgi:hypothetical protein